MRQKAKREPIPCPWKRLWPGTAGAAESVTGGSQEQDQMPILSRRAFLAALLPAALPLGEAAAQAPAAPLTFSAVVVDVTHLRDIGLGPFADVIQAAMTDEL